jgi:hypothetical protein
MGLPAAASSRTLDPLWLLNAGLLPGLSDRRTEEQQCPLPAPAAATLNPLLGPLLLLLLHPLEALQAPAAVRAQSCFPRAGRHRCD